MCGGELEHVIRLAAGSGSAMELLAIPGCFPDLIGFGRDLAVLSGCAALSVMLASMMLARAWRRV